MKILQVLISFLLILPIYSFSQDGNAYGSFSGKEAKKMLKKARKDVDYGNYKDASEKYSQLIKSDSANTVYYYEYALILYNNFEQIKSIPYFEKLIKHSKDTTGEVFYFLATAYHLAGKFDLAENNYKTYISLIARYGTDLWPEEEGELRNEVLHKVEMCDNGKTLIKTPVDKISLSGKMRPFQILNAGKNINSDYDDYDAVLSSNDSLMYFTSRREGTIGGKVDWDDKYFEDIYVSTQTNQEWGVSAGIGESVNSDKHEAIVGISADGNKIYFYKGVKQGTFYSSSKNGNAWTKPETLYEQSDINTKAWETSMFGFTLATNELFVVTDRDGGTGGRDIYVSKKQADGSWGPLEDIGNPINTEYHEDAPFITSDGKTMYFSSTGHTSMGGFDIFKSERNGDKWSAPVNLGVPINTPGDDIFFTIAHTSDRAYYSSSDRAPDSTSDMDIYMIDLCDDVPTTIINGFAQGISNGMMIVVEKESGKEVGKFEIKENKYSIYLERGKNYVFTVKTSGIEPASAEAYVPRNCKAYPLYQELAFTQAGQPMVFKNAFFDINKEAGAMSHSEFLAKADKSKLSNYTESVVNTNPMMTVSVDTIKTTTTTTVKDTATSAVTTTTATTTIIKTTISFDNVLFDYDKSNLRKEFLPELDKALALLKKDYPNVKFEVAGHTDSKGKDSYNMNLSKRRASAVANYFASKGINRSRMKVVGYGATKPVASNDTDEGRAKNRRTEIVIIQ